jgi:hypothetical protein
VIVAADLNAAADGISRDIDELLTAGWFGAIVLTVIFGLPVASLLAMLAQRWLAVVPLTISLASASCGPRATPRTGSGRRAAPGCSRCKS